MHLTHSTLPLLCLTALSLALPKPEGQSHALSKRADLKIKSARLSKRDDPKIGNGIDTNDPQRGGKLISPPGQTTGAFANALELMSYAVTLPGDTNDAVFGKYFNSGDKDTVQNVFKKLLGGAQSTSGAKELGQITVTNDEPDEGDPAPAELTGFDDPNPNLLLSDDAL